MSERDDGGPVFPRDHAHDGHNGMSLRDYFAIHASDADLRRFIDEGLPRVRARYAFADQMLGFRGTGHSDLK